jgi:hypothetical protein
LNFLRKLIKLFEVKVDFAQDLVDHQSVVHLLLLGLGLRNT